MDQHDQQTVDADTQARGYVAPADDAPHECEFCSPEPEIMPAPWERESGQGDQPAVRDLDEGMAMPETIGELWV